MIAMAWACESHAPARTPGAAALRRRGRNAEGGDRGRRREAGPGPRPTPDPADHRDRAVV